MYEYELRFILIGWIKIEIYSNKSEIILKSFHARHAATPRRDALASPTQAIKQPKQPKRYPSKWPIPLV